LLSTEPLHFVQNKTSDPQANMADTCKIIHIICSWLLYVHRHCTLFCSYLGVQQCCDADLLLLFSVGGRSMVLS